MTTDIKKAARQYFAYFNQGKWWVPNGKPPVLVTDMDAAWRHNAAAFLVRRAGAYLFQYDLGELHTVWAEPSAPSNGSAAFDSLERACDEGQEQRNADPEAWIKTTSLYQALVKDLHDGIADLAKHWSDCAIRTDAGECTCWERHVTECPKREDINARCQCRDYSPEWTR